MTNQELIYSKNPQIGDLCTPVNSSYWVKKFINELPIYRSKLTCFKRGLEIGMAHGYFIIGPFVKLGPLRDSNFANLAGLLAAIALIKIATLALSAYITTNPPKPLGGNTVEVIPPELYTQQGWRNLSTGFLIGGIGGAITAYSLLAIITQIQNLF